MRPRHAAVALALAVLALVPGREAAAQVVPNGNVGLSANVGNVAIGGPSLSACQINARACQKQPQPTQGAGQQRGGSTAMPPPRPGRR